MLWQSGGFRLATGLLPIRHLEGFIACVMAASTCSAALACIRGRAWLVRPVIATSSDRRHNDLVLESLHSPVLARFPGAEFAGFASVVLVRFGYADANAVDVRIVECNVDV